MEIKPIAFFRSPFGSKFGIPRQSGVVGSLRGRVEFLPEYGSAEALRGLDGFSYVWLIWGFSANRPQEEFHATVRPPRLGGNRRVGVFATRSPYRPNGLGLSAVRLARVADGAIDVLGADLMDGTPIYDVKPYLPYADAHPDAKAGFTSQEEWPRLSVRSLVDLLQSFTPDEAAQLQSVLSLDPRPRYQSDGDKEYGMEFLGRNVRFKITDNECIITQIEQENGRKQTSRFA